MTTSTAPAATPIALGLRALRGGAVAVGVTMQGGQPRVVLSTFVATAAEGDRLALEPYTVAAGMERGADGTASATARAAVAEGRARQDELAARHFDALVRRLRESGHAPIVAALLVNRAGWMTDLLAHALSAPEHPPVIEGLAVREALRFAFGRIGMKTVEVDEKSLQAKASDLLGVPADALDERLRQSGKAVGPPWRKEQKMACLAAWITLLDAP